MAPGESKRDDVREMFYERGLRPREIATLLGISTQAVYKHLTAIRQEIETKAAS